MRSRPTLLACLRTTVLAGSLAACSDRSAARAPGSHAAHRPLAAQVANAANANDTAGPAALPAVLVGAGDIAGCNWGGDEATAALLDTIAGVVFTVGDDAYPDGTGAQFAQCYGPSWGRHKARTRPTPGNHDYRTAEAAPYFDYFGAAAGEPGKGYYSYDVGAWHVVGLNSQLAPAAMTAQVAWLRHDLAAHPAACTLAYWHYPLFSSGRNGDNIVVQPLWDALYEAGVDVVLNGHDHDYERFAPQAPTGSVDRVRGIREFVVGTGGAHLGEFTSVQPNSEIRRIGYGVLKLELSATAYHWSFIDVNEGVVDSGSDICH